MGFLDLLVWLIEIRCHEDFEKKQIKIQTESNLKDIYLEMLGMVDRQNLKVPMPDISHAKLDSQGVQRFILKYLEEQISINKI